MCDHICGLHEDATFLYKLNVSHRDETSKMNSFFSKVSPCNHSQFGLVCSQNANAKLLTSLVSLSLGLQVFSGWLSASWTSRQTHPAACAWCGKCRWGILRGGNDLNF